MFSVRALWGFQFGPAGVDTSELDPCCINHAHFAFINGLRIQFLLWTLDRFHQCVACTSLPSMCCVYISSCGRPWAWAQVSCLISGPCLKCWAPLHHRWSWKHFAFRNLQMQDCTCSFLQASPRLLRRVQPSPRLLRRDTISSLILFAFLLLSVFLMRFLLRVCKTESESGHRSWIWGYQSS